MEYHEIRARVESLLMEYHSVQVQEHRVPGEHSRVVRWIPSSPLCIKFIMMGPYLAKLERQD